MLVVLALAATAAMSGAALGAVGTVVLSRDCSFSRATWAAGRESEGQYDQYEVMEHDLRLLVRCGTLDRLPAGRVNYSSAPLTANATVSGATTSASQT